MMFVGLDTLKKTKSLFWCHCIVHDYSTYVCNTHSIHEGDKPARQETRPVQASSLCGVNVLKLRLPSTFFLRHLHSIHTKVPFLTLPTHTDKAA